MIPNAWAVTTNITQMAIFADIRSFNPPVTAGAAEFFLDSTNGVVFGAGTPMVAVDGVFNSTNELAQAIFTPSFSAGERHVVYIHAQGLDNRWCPFVQVVLNPSVDDILNRIQANYSAIRDLSFDSSDLALVNGAIQSSTTTHVKQKGAYRFRIENPADGSLEVINNNFDVKLDAGQQVIKYKVYAGMDNLLNSLATGPSTTPDSDQLENFCWDIPTFRQAYSAIVDTSAVQGSNGCYYLVATAKDGSETIQMAINASCGVPILITFNSPDTTPLVRQFSNLTEIRPGIWLPLGQTDSMTLSSDVMLEWKSNMSSVHANQELNDALFIAPQAP